MKTKILGILVCTLLIAVAALPVVMSMNDLKDGKDVSMLNKECGGCQESGQPIQLPVGICDNFTFPTEPTYPSDALLAWIAANYPFPDTKPCDADPEDRYWAHTFNLNGLCPCCRIESAILEITVRNDDDNDHLKVGCITSPTDNWEHSVRLDTYIPVGDTGTINLDLSTIPNLLGCMETDCNLSVAVDDDSPVDCAILTIWCRECINPPPDLVAWWPLDEDDTPGGLSADIIGDNHGTWMGSPIPIAGKVAGALNFPNDGDYVMVPAPVPDVEFGTDDFTIDCWVYPTANGDARTIISKREGDMYNHLGYCLFINEDGNLAMILGKGTGYLRIDSILPVPTNQWTFVAVVVGRSWYPPPDPRIEVRFFTDFTGNYHVIQNFTQTVTNNGDLFIGKDHYISEHAFPGRIDEVELFNRALNEGELWQICYAGCAGKCKPDLCCNGSCNWSDVNPGGTVTCSFTVYNCGGPGSELDWEVSEYPGWGTWTFTPSSGDDLTPEDGSTTVQVEVIAPNQQNTGFTGEIKICNTHDPNDCCTIPVYLKTPVNQQVVVSNQQILKTIFQRFLSFRQSIFGFPLTR